MGKVLRADGTLDNAYVEFDLDTPETDAWLTFDFYVPAEPLATWLASPNTTSVNIAAIADNIYLANNAVGPHTWQGGSDPPTGGDTPAPSSDGWHTFELHVTESDSEFFIDSDTVWSTVASFPGSDTSQLILGLFPSGMEDNTGPAYFREVRLGTTRGAADLFSDDFSSDDLSSWTSTSGDVSVVDDPFGPPPPPYSVVYDGNGSDGGTAPVDAESPYAAGSTVKPLEPGDLTLTDYEFARWNTEADGSGITHHAGVTFSMPANNLTLYAQWIVAPVLIFPGRRVGIAFDDGPLEPNPTWTYLDDATVFPPQFVAGYDTRNGRQTLISQTETGTATVYINDRAGLFDDRNFDSPYIGQLSGRQILLQLWNPVTEVWEPQFRGIIDDYNYDIDAATDAHGNSINANIQLECVDIFDYLNGYGLTPGLDGFTPPAGMEDGVWYEQTTGTVQDRFITILTNANVDSTMYHLAQGNVNVIGVKYDPDESALTALRDAADAELPFIANIYVDRYGRFRFSGRYSRFYPNDVAAGPGDWDFDRWGLGDGKNIRDNPFYNSYRDEYQQRGQIRELSFTRSRADIINAAIAWAQGTDPADMPGQVYAATGSIDDFGKHQAAPMSDLIMCAPFTYDPQGKNEQAALYAQLLVENKKQPHMEITRLQLKSMRPDDPRAAATWGAICGADISHIVNVAAGYPGGTGFTGESLDDDHYIEGRSLTVRPLNPTHDYVECDLNVSPAIWSMDTFGVFFNPFA